MKILLSSYRFITRTKEVVDLGGTMRLGKYPCLLKEGTKVYQAMVA